MSNIFSEVEDYLLSETDENIIFDESKIKEFTLKFISDKLKFEESPHFFFEKIVYDFFEYKKIQLIKTKKTRDQGIDGIIKLNLDLVGEISLGLQIKYKTIDSNDIDLFLSSLHNAELRLGVLICKDSRRLDKYELNTKIKTILFSRGVEIKSRLIKEKIDLNPIFILKFEDMVNIIVSEIRSCIRAIYKK